MNQPLSAALSSANVAASYWSFISPGFSLPNGTMCTSARSAIGRAIGSTVAGCRAVACVAGIELASALAPLTATAYTGCHRGLVIISCDGFRASNCGTEFDSRPAAKLAELPVVEPRSAQEMASLLLQCFAWSESIGLPVIFRIVPEHLESTDASENLWQLPDRGPHFLRKHNRWVTAAHIAYARKRASHDRLRRFARALETSPFDSVTRGADIGIVTTGASTRLYQRLEFAPENRPDHLALSSGWPLPKKSLRSWLKAHKQVLVVENGQPFIEEQLKVIAQEADIRIKILGQASRHMPQEGSPQLTQLTKALEQMTPNMALCASQEPYDPYGAPEALDERSPFYTAIETLNRAIEKQPGRTHCVIATEPGPLGGLNETPWELVDVRYSRGTSMALANGLRCNSHLRAVCVVDRPAFTNAGLEAIAVPSGQDRPVATMLLWDDRTSDTFDIAQVLNALNITWYGWNTEEKPNKLENLLDTALQAEQDALVLVRHQALTN